METIFIRTEETMFRPNTSSLSRISVHGTLLTPLVVNEVFKALMKIWVSRIMFDQKAWSNVLVSRNGEARVRLTHQIWILLLRCYMQACLVNS